MQFGIKIDPQTCDLFGHDSLQQDYLQGWYQDEQHKVQKHHHKIQERVTNLTHTLWTLY